MGKSRSPLKKSLKKLKKIKTRDYGLVLLGAILVLAMLAGISMLPKKSTTTPLAAGQDVITSPWIPATVKQWSTIIQEMGRKYNIDPNLVAIIMTIESGGNPQAKSGVGAQGLLQIMPGTAHDIAAKHLKSPQASYDIYDPRTNIEFGTAYLAYLRTTFGTTSQGPTWDETAELIGAGYNGGPGAAKNLENGLGLQSLETSSYSRDVYNMWRERNAPVSPTYSRWLERGGSTLVDKAATATKP
jgi:soluble lytic murein transglycosylase-like protein